MRTLDALRVFIGIILISGEVFSDYPRQANVIKDSVKSCERANKTRRACVSGLFAQASLPTVSWFAHLFTAPRQFLKSRTNTTKTPRDLREKMIDIFEY